MTHVSRPLIALLLGTVVFFAVWTVALKPSSSSSGSSSSGAGSYQSAIDKAHQAVTTSGKASVAHGGTLPTIATTPSRPTVTTAHARPATATTAPSAAKPATTTPATTKQGTTAATTTPATTTPTTATAGATAVSAKQQRVSTTEGALDAGKVVALLFYNPAAAEDRAVKQELAAVSTSGSNVVKLAVPLSEASAYPFITQHVQLTNSPTLVLIDRSRQATTIVGFADRFEIQQRVADALAVPAK